MSNYLNDNEVGIYALGGLGEIGKNMYCIEYLNQIFIVDCGLLFPDERLLGIDAIVPDFTHLKENEDKIVGLFITHGHEDHIGGIPYLLQQVNIKKIYASGVAVELIQDKLSEIALDKPNIIEYKSNHKFKFNGVTVSFIRMTHSIPDAFAICFNTPYGNILHSGDFKFDFTPLGPATEYDKLTKIADEGVLCMLADSTNALVEGFTISERKVYSSLRDIFDHIEGRALIATFASNLYRVQQIIDISIKFKRHVAVFGRSMEKTIEIGQNAGLIKAKKDTFITADQIPLFPPNQITILCTGSQGEPLAALSRIANGTHKFIKTIPGDTVIFSSSPIPGNNAGVNKTINQLFRNGVNVITNSPLTDVHTSGHAANGELKLMQSLVKPKYFMPIHGEYRMLVAHMGIAMECGVRPDNIFVIDNGTVVSFSNDGAKISGNVHTGLTYIDGSTIGDLNSAIIKERRILSDEGMVSIVITINERTKEIMMEPTIISRGFVYMKSSEDLTRQISNNAYYTTKAELEKTPGINQVAIKNSIINSVSKLIEEKTSRKPLIIVNVMIV
ncbi:MAG: ribonuclease J [Acholeplasmatales bacterium]|nr:ribonuclease J [Acholeplasmatales bacterium]